MHREIAEHTERLEHFASPGNWSDDRDRSEEELLSSTPIACTVLAQDSLAANDTALQRLGELHDSI